MISCSKASSHCLHDSAPYTTTATSQVMWFLAHFVNFLSPRPVRLVRFECFMFCSIRPDPYHSFVQAVSSRVHLDKNEDVSHWPPGNTVFGHCFGSGDVTCSFYDTDTVFISSRPVGFFVSYRRAPSACVYHETSTREPPRGCVVQHTSV